MQVVLRAVEKQYPEVEILEMNTDEDHIHLIVVIPPKFSVSQVVNVLKFNSSRMMRARFPFLATMYEYENLGLWSDGYFVSTAGINESFIKKYIQQQGLEDKGQTKFVW